MERLDPTLSIPEIGTKLGVATVLEGGVQRAGGRVRINVQLIDCKTEAHLWAETYDRELTAANIFAPVRGLILSSAPQFDGTAVIGPAEDPSSNPYLLTVLVIDSLPRATVMDDSSPEVFGTNRKA
jgi:hypothetical protein